MSFRDLLYEIFHALKANKGRSALTILGIVIGIAAVVTMTSLIAGMRQQLLSEVGADKSRLIQLASYDQQFTKADVQYLQKNVTAVERIGATSDIGQMSVSNKFKTQDFSIKSALPGSLRLDEKAYPINKGRYFLSSDDQFMRQVCILDAEATKQLYGDENADPVGSTIRIGTDNFSVIGTLERASGSFNFNMGGTVYIPSNTATARFGAHETFYGLFVMIKEGTDAEAVKDQLINALYTRYPNVKRNTGDVTTSSAGFIAMTQQDTIKMVDSITGVFTAILSSVAGISLIVGGIGIMNMMLTNVTERIREIGLRKSIGAKSRDITNQFIGESIVLCLIGGIIGLIFGYLAALGIAEVMKIINDSLDFTPIITPSIALTAFGVSAFIGIIFGWGPARRAAKLDPVESLRHQ